MTLTYTAEDMAFAYETGASSKDKIMHAFKLGPYANDGGAALDENGPKTAIATWTGWSFDVCAPQTWKDSFRIQDIARSLSNTCRFNGHVEFYSVAEHAVRVSQYLEDQGHDKMTQYLGLHHDDTEAYLIGDVASPQKKLVRVWGTEMKTLERYLAELHLYPWLGINATVDRINAVHAADGEVYLLERAERPWSSMRPGKKGMSPTTAKVVFLARDKELRRELELIPNDLP